MPAHITQLGAHLYARAQSSASATSTDSNGCVVCPSTTPSCPKCSTGEECQLRAQSCSSCPTYYCATASGTTSASDGGSSPVGPIVGGVVGGVAFIAILAVAFWYYKYVYRKKHPVELDDDDEMMMDGVSGKDADDLAEKDGAVGAGAGESGTTGDGAAAVSAATGADSLSNSSTGLSSGNTATLEKPPTRRTNSNPSSADLSRRRLSSYESFTRPKTRYNKKQTSDTAAQRRARQRQIVDQANQQTAEQLQNQNVYMDSQSSNRNSVATSISTTGASNILPIAYIPGVTVRPTKNNTRSIYSYETDSIFSDLNTIENASIIGDVMRANNAATATHGTVTEVHEGDGAKNGTMTAIKAQPRLVNVDRIEEEEEYYDDVTDEEGEQDEDDEHERERARARGLQNTAHTPANKPSLLSHASPQKDDSDFDSDVDSDIGEITRATSLSKPKRLASEVLEIPLDLMHTPPRGAAGSSGSPAGSSGAGSFLLDVEMDAKRASDASSEKSPFEDPPEADTSHR